MRELPFQTIPVVNRIPPHSPYETADAQHTPGNRRPDDHQRPQLRVAAQRREGDPVNYRAGVRPTPRARIGPHHRPARSLRHGEKRSDRIARPNYVLLGGTALLDAWSPPIRT